MVICQSYVSLPSGAHEIKNEGLKKVVGFMAKSSHGHIANKRLEMTQQKKLGEISRTILAPYRLQTIGSLGSTPMNPNHHF